MELKYEYIYIHLLINLSSELPSKLQNYHYLFFYFWNLSWSLVYQLQWMNWTLNSAETKHIECWQCWRSFILRIQWCYNIWWPIRSIIPVPDQMTASIISIHYHSYIFLICLIQGVDICFEKSDILLFLLRSSLEMNLIDNINSYKQMRFRFPFIACDNDEVLSNCWARSVRSAFWPLPWVGLIDDEVGQQAVHG